MSNEECPPPDTEQFERELIARAKAGDADAGKKILLNIALKIDLGQFDSELFPYLADCIWDFAYHGIRLDRALNVEAENKGGRPPKYETLELAAVDILLRDYANFRPEAALTWICENIGVDRRHMQRVRSEHDQRYNKHTDKPLMESCERDFLLHLSGSLRQKVAEVLPHT
ncbi:MAG TPA: hypothetical protein VHJ19_01980 [Gammaproteobacteria bacterium]|nr:hypothetical protein [Gammaproteobacteria bacterium]